MVEPVNNNNVYTVDMLDKTKAGVTPEVQKDNQASTATPEVQSPKKQDTVTISKEAVEAQQGTAQTAPEQARVQSMQEAQNPANQTAVKNNPMEALVKAYGVSK